MDPFVHHPGLRGLISPPRESLFFDFDPDALFDELAAKGVRGLERFPEEVREADRRAFLEGHEGDLWVFGYGSLMWDPAIRFAEVRRADVSGHARRFILKDVFGGRGDQSRPGLMVALDRLPGTICHGLAFRIRAEHVEAESFRLWRRERVGPGYIPAWVTADTGPGPVRAATFVADHGAELIDASLGFDEQVEYCATGSGVFGSSLDYARNIAAHLAELRIEDAELTRLLAAAEARAAEG